MLVASRISGNSLVNDLCCLVTCVVWHVFHVGMMEMEECGSTFNRDWHARVVQALHLRLEKVVSMADHWESRDFDDDGFKDLGAEYPGMLTPNCSYVGTAEPGHGRIQ